MFDDGSEKYDYSKIRKAWESYYKPLKMGWSKNFKCVQRKVRTHKFPDGTVLKPMN